ncbi:MAG: TerB family tellurite resistance protein, partial [Candidatus Thiodiazotropha sp.]
LGEREHAASTDYFQFTSLINKHYSAEQKVWLIEALWRVAFADQKLHQYEEHVIRRLSELLYVPHSDFIAAKLRVQDV